LISREGFGFVEFDDMALCGQSGKIKMLRKVDAKRKRI
jgi:hypothetical protein